ncbi:Thiopurine S-methyltransferase [Lamellibrachia satsuma]|nr:Thiopurine S-methyltransferase [Lamellibrachia satsuma]
MVKHVDVLVNGNPKAKVLFPFCGKTKDMKWVADKGHEVVGIEGSKVAAKQFAEDHQLQYTVLPIEGTNIVLYKYAEANVRIYVGDVWEFNSSIECNFDAIWDRGGFTIINIKDRKKYIPLITSLMAPHARYMLCIDTYDENVIQGPPHSLDPPGTEEMFGRVFDIKYVDKRDSLKPLQKSWGLTFFDETLYQLTFKQ